MWWRSPTRRRCKSQTCERRPSSSDCSSPHQAGRQRQYSRERRVWWPRHAPSSQAIPPPRPHPCPWDPYPVCCVHRIPLMSHMSQVFPFFFIYNGISILIPILFVFSSYSLLFRMYVVVVVAGGGSLLLLFCLLALLPLLSLLSLPLAIVGGAVYLFSRPTVCLALWYCFMHANCVFLRSYANPSFFSTDVNSHLPHLPNVC